MRATIQPNAIRGFENTVFVMEHHFGLQKYFWRQIGSGENLLNKLHLGYLLLRELL
ncbi:hypothetical protein [Rossellomorea vietnamensis]|uniref:hypothetical protein n=1 Tax=Rossellomorea vietnamensis TaxID=218284 RepID=UPI000A5DE6D9|nr:hypothetical protein [Rossellomorea vietnamensis]